MTIGSEYLGSSSGWLVIKGLKYKGIKVSLVTRNNTQEQSKELIELLLYYIYMNIKWQILQCWKKSNQKWRNVRK